MIVIKTHSILFLRLLLLVCLLFPGVFSYAQCPSINAGQDTVMDCDSTCVTLTATVAQTGLTNSYSVAQIPYNPFSYTAGTSILLNIDDKWSSVLNIGFNFCFYGTPYNQLVIGSNGLISFNLSYANGFCPWQITAGIPSTANPTNSIMAPYHDTDPSVGGVIRWATYGTAPCRIFVISWYNVPMYSCNNLISTQQVVLYETTNTIETYILNKPLCNSWNSGAAIHGIQNATGTIATVVPGRNYPTQWTASNDAWRFTPSGGQNYTITWYDINMTQIGTGASIQVCPTVDTDYIAEAIYTNCDGNQVIVDDTITVFMDTCAVCLPPVMDSVMISCNGACDGMAWGFADQDSSIGPWTYVWYDSQNNIISTTPVTTDTVDTVFNLCADTFLLEITDSQNCVTFNTVIITEPPLLTVSDTNVVDVLCNGDCTGQATVLASGGTQGYTFSWSTGTTTATDNALCAGTHTVTVTDANGCQDSINITIVEPPSIILSTGSTPASCGQADGSVWVNSSGGVGPYQYIWNNGCTLDSCGTVQAGYYTVTVTDANGCTEIASDSVSELNAFTLNTLPQYVSCKGDCDGSVNLNVVGGSPPFNYTWNNGETSEDISDLCIGVYEVTVTDNLGCTGEFSTVIGIGNPDPLANFVADPNPTTVRNTEVDFYDNSEGDIVQWTWTFFDNDSSTLLGGSNEINPVFVYPEDTGTYCALLEVVTDAGCTDDTVRCIYIDGVYNVFIPNAFTPNGDGLNDYFFPQGIGIRPDEEFEFMIFDRWGELIFFSKSMDDQWDGTARAKGSTDCVQNGVYIWKLKTKESTRKSYEHEYIGHVSLLR